MTSRDTDPIDADSMTTLQLSLTHDRLPVAEPMGTNSALGWLES
jgi:hypothetical protein